MIAVKNLTDTRAGTHGRERSVRPSTWYKILSNATHKILAPFSQRSFTLYCYYSHLLNASILPEFTPRMFTAPVHYWGNLLTGSQPAQSKREPEQLKWLIKKYSLFLEHQANKTTGQFFPPLYEEYFSLWPPTPIEEDVSGAGGSVPVATATVRQREEHVRGFELALIGVN